MQEFNKKVIHILIFFFFFCVIILSIMLFNWGSLPKDQENPQTINEAITEAIASHESDPTAHLGVGESLEQHKTNEIIDHPALSVVPDKFSNAESFFNVNVWPADFGNEDNCEIEGWQPFLGLYQTGALSGAGGYPIANLTPTDLGYVDGDAIFDFVISQSGGAGTRLSDLTFGFGKVELKDNYYRIGYYTTSWQYSDWFSVDETKLLRFRFFYSKIDGKLYVYLRGTEVLNVSYTLAFASSQMQIYAHVNRGTSSSCTTLYGNIQYWLAGM